MGITSNIGKNIRKLRTNMGISQVEIANFLGVDQSLISKIEKGERSISSDMLDELSSLFGVSLFDMQKEDIEPVNLSFAFRSSGLTLEDMKSIVLINRIALNSEYMSELCDVHDILNEIDSISIDNAEDARRLSAIRRDKVGKRGRFEKHIFLESVEYENK